MKNEIAILLGATVAAATSCLTTLIISRNQIKVAKEKSKNDLELQSNRHLDERVKTEIKLEREKLEELHKILSKIALENSRKKIGTATILLASGESHTPCSPPLIDLSPHP